MKLSDVQWKLIFGFILLGGIITLAILVARQNKELQQVNNTDLQQVLTVLSVLAGNFAQWAFSTSKGDDKKEPPKEPPK